MHIEKQWLGTIRDYSYILRTRVRSMNNLWYNNGKVLKNLIPLVRSDDTERVSFMYQTAIHMYYTQGQMNGQYVH